MNMHMRVHEVDSVDDLEHVARHHLATASGHNAYVDLGSGYNPNLNPRSSPRNPELIRTDDKAPQVVWNDRDKRFAYMGSKHYEITQHKEVVKNLLDAVEQTTGEIDAAIIRDYGERIDGVAILKGHTVDVEDIVGDGYIPPESQLMDSAGEQFYGEDGEWGAGDVSGSVRDILGVGVRFRNSFDGKEKIGGETMGYRFICQNWMVWGESIIGSKDQLHMSELSPEFFEDLIFDVMEKKTQIEDVIVEANANSIPLNKVGPTLEASGFGRNYSKRIGQILEDYLREDEDEVDRWRLYNAVTFVLDHYTIAEKQVNLGVYDSHQKSAMRLLTGDTEAPESKEMPFNELIEKEN